MRAPYGLNILESCLTCPVREEHLFCNLPDGALADFEALKATAAYPKGAILFIEGQPARGIFLLCSGRAKLTTTSSDGKTIILKIAEPGEVLGLSATLSAKPYEANVEVLEPSQANFVSRVDFLKFLHDHGEAALQVAKQLSSNCHCAYQEIRTLGLSHSASEKLARMLLDWSADHDHNRNGGLNEIKLTLTLTHEEIGQMIGSSRETVTRLFAEFKKKKLIQVHGSTLVIKNKSGLEAIVDS